jgi:hypothetical protein
VNRSRLTGAGYAQQVYLQPHPENLSLRNAI